MDQTSAVLIAAVLASVGWYVTNRQNVLLARRKHTYEIFESYRTETRHRDGIKAFAAMVISKTVPQQFKPPNTDSDVDLLFELINHYEFIAAGIWSGDIDEKFIRSCEFSRMTKLFDLTKPFIDSTRDTHNQPSFAENLEHLVRRWRTTHPTNRAGVYEFFALKPSRDWESATAPRQ